PVALTYPATNTVTVNYATADGTAVASQDYVSTSGTLTFNPGATQQVINVSIVGSPLPKPDQFFSVALSNPTNATFSRSTATGLIHPTNNLVVTTYPDWRATNSVPPEIADGADADGDGFSTISEYALSLNPNVFDATNSPLSSRLENGLLKMIYPRLRP